MCIMYTYTHCLGEFVEVIVESVPSYHVDCMVHGSQSWCHLPLYILWGGTHVCTYSVQVVNVLYCSSPYSFERVSP